MPEFSVLMPVYWKENSLRFSSALASVFTNTHLPSETLVICDGPLTESLEMVIDEYVRHPGFRVVRLKKNEGIVGALNRGLKEVCNDIVVRCDSDDVNYPERFERLVRKLEEGFDVVGSQVHEVDSVGNIIQRKQLPTSHDEIIRYAKKRNPLNHMSVAFRASDVIAIGGYPDVYLKEDYALWAKLIGVGKRFANLQESLVYASGGIDLYARRGGLKAALSEVALQHILVCSGVSGPLGAFMTGLARFAVLSAPPSLRAFFYCTVLPSVSD
jgi:glycosyltransferase involved in cell wall biosynthesis